MNYSKKDTLIIRADNDIQMGTGHLMRCLALSQAWKDTGGNVILITSCQNEQLLEHYQHENCEIDRLDYPYSAQNDWLITKKALELYPNSWIVLDGYHFDDKYQKLIKESNHRLLVIDDQAHLKHYYCDIVLNQNLNSDRLIYLAEPYTKLLLGNKYVLLRREFLNWSNRKEQKMEIPLKLLITLGGSDPENHTQKLIQALQILNMPSLETRILVGVGNSNYQQLAMLIKDIHLPITLIQNAQNMPELMAWSNVAISSAGTTVWELAYMGIPAILLIMAENQKRTAEELQAIEACVNLGWASDINILQLAETLGQILRDLLRLNAIGQKIKLLVDGDGVKRVIMHLKNQKLRLRKCNQQDCELLWHWANDSYVRAMSFSPNTISWEDHVKWFSTKHNTKQCVHFIGLDEMDNPVGQVRFDLHDHEAEISVSLDNQKRGKGNGSLLIDIGSQQMFSNSTIDLIHAFIKPQNTASTRAFKRAGFKEIRHEIMRGHEVLHLVRERTIS